MTHWVNPIDVQVGRNALFSLEDEHRSELLLPCETTLGEISTVFSICSVDYVVTHGLSLHHNPTMTSGVDTPIDAKRVHAEWQRHVAHKGYFFDTKPKPKGAWLVHVSDVGRLSRKVVQWKGKLNRRHRRGTDSARHFADVVRSAYIPLADLADTPGLPPDLLSTIHSCDPMNQIVVYTEYAIHGEHVEWFFDILPVHEGVAADNVVPRTEANREDQERHIVMKPSVAGRLRAAMPDALYAELKDRHPTQDCPPRDPATVRRMHDQWRTTCMQCKKPPPPGTKLRMCGACKTARYCSADCQKKGWYDGGHRELCSLLSIFSKETAKLI
jgi:hypothetical protein